MPQIPNAENAAQFMRCIRMDEIIIRGACEEVIRPPAVIDSQSDVSEAVLRRPGRESTSRGTDGAGEG